MPDKVAAQVFIVGNSRSGTTMLGRVLGNHSQIHTFGELHFFEQQVDGATVRERPAWSQRQLFGLLERLLTSAREGLFRQVEPGRYREQAGHILAAAQANDPVSVYGAFLHYEAGQHGKTIPCEQTPRYLYFAAEILHAFPRARVINLVRDPRAVLRSQKYKWRRRYLGARAIPLREALRAWANYHPYIVARLWVSAVRAARRHESHPRFLSLQFEDLLQEPEKIVRRICSFLGVTYEPGMLEVPQIGSSIEEDRPERHGIDSSRSQSWRTYGLSAVELAICERVAGDEMLRLGYMPTTAAASASAWAASMAVLAAKAALALVVNLHRTRHLGDALRRRIRDRQEG